MTPPLGLWLRAFAITCAVEVPLVAWGLGRLRPGPLWPRLALALLAQVLTHPVLWYVVPPPSPTNYYAWLVICESGVTLVEAAVFATRVGVWRGLGLAVAANLTTTLLGLALAAAGLLD